MSLVLSRKLDQKIILKSRKTAQEIVVAVCRIQRGVVRLAIEADEEWDILRNEIIEGSVNNERASADIGPSQAGSVIARGTPDSESQQSVNSR